MSKLLYRLGVFIYIVGIRLAARFNAKAKRWVEGRQGLFGQLQQQLGSNEQPVIWMHCASLGEFEQGRPVLEALKDKYPQHKILLSFFSPSGYDKVHGNYPLADWIVYLPADSPQNAQKFIQIVQPKLVVFVKYEFWYYYLTQLQDLKIPTYLISAIFRPKQVFFKWYGGLFRELLFCFQSIFVQDEASVLLLEKVGYKTAIKAGDTRLDRVLEIKAQAKSFPLVQQFCQGSTSLVCGSTWPPDEALLAKFSNHHPSHKLVIAPHQINEAHLQQIQQLFAHTTTLRYSQKPNPAQLEAAQVLIIDNIGMLSSLYAYANMAYIGGGFGAGIHNSLEAAVYEIPVAFGSNYHKFKEAKDLLQEGIAFEIKTVQDLSNLAHKMQQPKASKSIAKKTQQYLEKHRGATDIIIKKLAP